MKYFLWLTLPLYVLDQLTKLAILKHFPDPWTTPPDQWRVIHVIPGFFDLVRVHNTGMAFGGFNNAQYANVIFCVIASIAILVVFILTRRGAFHDVLSRTAASLLVAGILGNLTDRLVHRYVVDFLSFDLGFMIWPSFNVADSCICVAAFFLVLTAFAKQPAETADEA